MPLEEHLSPQDIADLLHVHYDTVHGWIHQGRFRCVRKLGRKLVRVPLSEVNRFIVGREVEFKPARKATHEVAR